MRFGSQLYRLGIPVNPRQNRYSYPIFGQIQIGGRIRFSHFRRLFRPPPGRPFRLLDFGCGNGNYGFVLADKYPASRIDSYDADRSKFGLLRKLKNKPPNLFFLSGDDFDDLEPSSYDHILSIDVLEHIEDDAGTLKELARLLKLGGRLFIHVPRNHRKWRTLLKNIRREKHDGHLRDEYREKEIRGLVKKIETLRIRKLVYTFGFRGELAWEIDRKLIRCCPKLRYPLFPLLLLLARLDARGKNSWGNGFFIIAKKISGDRKTIRK